MTGGKAVCQVTYNIWRVDSSNTITEFTRICASLMGVTTGKKATNCVLGDKDCIISPTHSCDQQGFIKRYNAEHLTYLLMKKTLRHGEMLNT